MNFLTQLPVIVGDFLARSGHFHGSKDVEMTVILYVLEPSLNETYGTPVGPNASDELNARPSETPPPPMMSHEMPLNFLTATLFPKE